GPFDPVTFPVNPVAVLLLASSAVTCTAGVIAAPADVVLGCTENTSCVAVPAVILNAVLVAVPAPVAVSVYLVSTLSIDRQADVATPTDAACVAFPAKATPALAATVAVPANVPLPGFVPIATVTFPALHVALPFLASSAVTCTAGVIAAPADVVLGCTENTSCVAVPAVILNAVLVPVAGPVAVGVSAYPALSLAMDGPAAAPAPPAAAGVPVRAQAPAA